MVNLQQAMQLLQTQQALQAAHGAQNVVDPQTLAQTKQAQHNATTQQYKTHLARQQQLPKPHPMRKDHSHQPGKGGKGYGGRNCK